MPAQTTVSALTTIGTGHQQGMQVDTGNGGESVCTVSLLNGVQDTTIHLNLPRPLYHDVKSCASVPGAGHVHNTLVSKLSARLHDAALQADDVLHALTLTLSLLHTCGLTAE